jgi:hypothetical protein
LSVDEYVAPSARPDDMSHRVYFFGPHSFFRRCRIIRASIQLGEPIDYSCPRFIERQKVAQIDGTQLGAPSAVSLMNGALKKSINENVHQLTTLVGDDIC